jgi:hypothetical protein
MQRLLRKPEQEEPLGRIWRIMLNSVFERNKMGGLDFFCYAHDKSEWRILPHIVISNRVH